MDNSGAGWGIQPVQSHRPSFLGKKEARPRDRGRAVQHQRSRTKKTKSLPSFLRMYAFLRQCQTCRHRTQRNPGGAQPRRFGCDIVAPFWNEALDYAGELPIMSGARVATPQLRKVASITCGNGSQRQLRAVAFRQRPLSRQPPSPSPQNRKSRPRAAPPSRALRHRLPASVYLP
jgi:hypothetical protein